jgi:UDP-N-acetylmuramoylalanine--D-glutamate ligase
VEDFRNRNISVIGAARSGIDSSSVLVRLGARVTLSDSQSAEKLGPERVAEARCTGALFLPGAAVDEALPPGTELVITSPGVPRNAPVLQEAVRRGIPVWSEIELAYRLTDAPILATTGTNGKTTTTLLLAAMLQAAGRSAVVAGNVSADEIKRTLVHAAFATRPSPDSADGETDNRQREAAALAPLLVAEVSSFQLEWVDSFAPHVAILTNITPDHLNRHAGFEEYAQTKARLFARQRPEDWAILNYDDPTARAIGEARLPGRRLWFTHSDPPEHGPAAWVSQGTLLVRLEPDREPISLLTVQEMPSTLPGVHSVENVLAASAAALAVDAAPEAVAAAVREFRGVAHRMEIVDEIDGVRYINNSMCTNVAAAISALNALDRPAIVIAGGADKGLDFAPLAPVLRQRARHLILIGAATDKMERALRVGGMQAISRADSLEAAVGMARTLAVPGDAVLLSPACASFDMFRDFEVRGAAFRQAVRAVKEDAS